MKPFEEFDAAREHLEKQLDILELELVDRFSDPSVTSFHDFAGVGTQAILTRHRVHDFLLLAYRGSEKKGNDWLTNFTFTPRSKPQRS